MSPTRFRVPDVCVVLGRTDEQILTRPPFLCIEILSPEDRFGDMVERFDDYLAMGIANIWKVDPKRKRACYVTYGAWREEKSGTLKTEDPAIEVPLNEIFS